MQVQKIYHQNHFFFALFKTYGLIWFKRKLLTWRGTEIFIEAGLQLRRIFKLFNISIHFILIMSNNRTAQEQEDSFKMAKIYKWVNWLIIGTAILEFVGEALVIQNLRLVKPIPIILMILYLTQAIIKNKCEKKRQTMSNWVVIGLLFSLVGDILLMFSSITMFMAGTSFFLIAHFFYIWSFHVGQVIREPSSLQKKIINGLTIAFVLAYIGNIIILWDKFPNKALFAIYGSTICLLSILAIRRYKRTSHESYWCIIVGAVCFTVSDTILGFLKFNNVHSDMGRLFVMIFYYSAQFCLMHGAICHDNSNYHLRVFRQKQGNENLLNKSK